MKLKKIDPEEFYLDYVNNYITLACIAEAYLITLFEARKLYEAGREINHGRSKND